MSQTYQADGYLTESVGPVSIYQAALGIAAATGLGAAFYQRQMHGGDQNDVRGPAAGMPPTSAVTPSPDPDETRKPEP